MLSGTVKTLPLAGTGSGAGMPDLALDTLLVDLVELLHDCLAGHLTPSFGCLGSLAGLVGERLGEPVQVTTGARRLGLDSLANRGQGAQRLERFVSQLGPPC